MYPEIQEFSNIDDYTSYNARLIASHAQTAIEEKNYFTLVLSGGKTPNAIYRKLSTAPFGEQINWNRVYIFWGDERCVPPTADESNFGMATRHLLSRIDIPSTNIFNMHGEKHPQNAAMEYEKQLQDFFEQKEGAQPGLPAFDLTLLGMGTDGHAASLFPSSPSLEVTDKWIIPITPPTYARPHTDRLSMTLPLLNNSKHMLMLISGAEKRKILQEIIKNNNEASQKYPAARLTARESFIWSLLS